MTMADTTKTPTAKSTKKLGRPKKADPPRVSYHDLDRLLVFGEVVDEGNGMGPVTKYPSYRELRRRRRDEAAVALEHPELDPPPGTTRRVEHVPDVERHELVGW